MAAYEFLTEATVVDYVRERDELSSRIAIDQIRWVKEIGDGNLNLVFLLKDDQDQGLCIKQALPYVRMTGEGWPMTPERARHEAEALSAHGAVVPDLVPEVFFYDPQRYIIAMEDLSDHQVWRQALNHGEIHEGAATAVGRYMGACAFGTSAFTLDRDSLAAATARSLNPQLCLISDDLVFTEPLVDAGRNSVLEANISDVHSFQADAVVMRAMGWAKWKFLTQAETLIHGDLHTGSVMVRHADSDGTPSSVKVFDSEFAFYGPQAYDIGSLWANLILAAARAIALDEMERATWLLQQLMLAWQGFELEFRQRWPHRRDQRVFGAQFLDDVMQQWQRESWYFCAAEMSRRIIGAAKVTDIETLPTELRQGAIRGVLKLAQHIVRDVEESSSPAALAAHAQEILCAEQSHR